MRNTISWLALVLMAVALTVWWAKSNSSPHYQGKPLESWLTQLQSPNSTDKQAAEEAVKAIGTNAIPTLVKYLARTNTWLEVRAIKAFTPVANKLGLVNWDHWSENFYHSRAMCGFRVLGSKAAPAIPSLLALTKSPDSETREDSTFVLCYVSPHDATKEILRLVANTNRHDRAIGRKAMAELIFLHNEIAPEVMKEFTNTVAKRF